MKFYQEYLERKKFKVCYLNHDLLGENGGLSGYLGAKGIKRACLYDPVDAGLQKRLIKEFDRAGIRYDFLESPLFLCSREYLNDYFAGKLRYSMNSFYISQRKRLGILLENEKPAGGKWSFDRENRLKLKVDIIVPAIRYPRKNRFIAEAVDYVEEKFTDNPGPAGDFFYPVTHSSAKRWLDDFIENRLELFGPYEDAISVNERYLFHSLLSPLLNSGLLTVNQVLDSVLSHSQKKQVRLNSLEGFVRQLIGWREFMRAVYLLEGKKLIKGNFWGFNKKMPRGFYDGTTGIEPVDTVIEGVLKDGYAHHIERLMILGNFMLLCEISPKEVYRWFMELFIDAYEWVMVSNVFGMSQYAGGGIMTTKPYISSSNYIRKMSDYKTGPWCDLWDGLYWRFVFKHKKVFEGNPRMKIMAVLLEKMSDKKIKAHIDKAESYLNR